MELLGLRILVVELEVEVPTKGRGEPGAMDPRPLRPMRRNRAFRKLLPPFIQGWYLLTDAALDAHERNLVMTALNGNFSPTRVAQELRNQFSEHDVRRRDQHRRHQSYMGEAYDLEDDDDELGEVEDEGEGIGLNEEGFALMTNAEEEAQTALAAIQTAKRTLRDARQRQHTVKQNRKYYQNGGNRGAPSAAVSSPRMIATWTA